MGLKDLTNEQECSDAATYGRSFNGNANYQNMGSWSSNPTGCYIYDHGHMYFNSDPTGYNHGNARSFCWKGKNKLRGKLLNFCYKTLKWNLINEYNKNIYLIDVSTTTTHPPTTTTATPSIGKLCTLQFSYIFLSCYSKTFDYSMLLSYIVDLW